jgi:hypothetical protein
MLLCGDKSIDSIEKVGFYLQEVCLVQGWCSRPIAL